MPDFEDQTPAFDILDIHWTDLGKRALRATTRDGLLMRIILPADQALEHGAILLESSGGAVVTNLLPCLAMIITPRLQADLVQISYTIGNLHLPAEIGPEQILIPAIEAHQAALGRAGIEYDLDLRRVKVRRDDLPRIQLSADFQRK